MPALTEPSDSDLPAAMLALIGAIDRVDVAYQASRAAAGLDAGARTMTIARYLKAQREILGLSAYDVALRLQTDPPLKLTERLEWIRSIEAGLVPISFANASSYLAAVRLDVREADVLLRLIRDQEPQLQAIVE